MVCSTPCGVIDEVMLVASDHHAKSFECSTPCGVIDEVIWASFADADDFESCSTPCGVIDEVMASVRICVALSQCSTPCGVIDEVMAMPSTATAGDYEVLNALRRHRRGHPRKSFH